MIGRGSGKIYISYRRGRDSSSAGRLRDRLNTEFGASQIFMDLTVETTVQFPKEVQQEIATSRVMLVVITKGWLAEPDDFGRPLGHSDNFVTREIEAAFQSQLVVIPILINGAAAPHEAELPPPLSKLARCNALPLDHASYEGDIQKIVEFILTPPPLREGERPRELWDERWRAIENGGSRAALVAFLNDRPPEDLAVLAHKRLEEMDWRTTNQANTSAAFAYFARAYPESKNAPEAKRKAQTLKLHEGERVQRQQAEQRSAEKAQRAKAFRTWSLKLFKRFLPIGVLCAVIIGFSMSQVPGTWAWWMRTGGLVWKTGIGRSPDRKLSFSRDGKTLIVLNSAWTPDKWLEKELEKWSVADGAFVSRVRIEGSRFGFSADAHFVLAGKCETGCIASSMKVFDLETGQELKGFPRIEGEIKQLTISNDGSLALTSSCVAATFQSCINGSVTLWDVAQRTSRGTFSGHPKDINALAFSPDGSIFISGSSDGTLKVWETKTGREITTVSPTIPQNNAATSITVSNIIAISNDGRRAVSIGRDAVVRETETSRATRKSQIKGTINWTGFSPGGRYVLTIGEGLLVFRESSLTLQAASDGSILRTFHVTGRHAAISPDGHYAASISDTDHLSLWDFSPYIDAAKSETYYIDAANPKS